MEIERVIRTMEYNKRILGTPDQGIKIYKNANTIACDIAIEALRKQNPKKVSSQDMQNICPNRDCMEKVLRHYTYCCDCGQKLDWD